MNFLNVGAGLSGAVLARGLADEGHRVTVIDSRSHVAGNCHTERCPETGVLVHIYGPHIFHTDDAQVWEYVNNFATFRPTTTGLRARQAVQFIRYPSTCTRLTSSSARP